MSEDRNEPASNTPPPLVPPPVRAPETRSTDTGASENTSGDAERDSSMKADESVSAHTSNDSAEQPREAASDDSRFAPQASRSTGAVPVAHDTTSERDSAHSGTANADTAHTDTARTDTAHSDTERRADVRPDTERRADAQPDTDRRADAQPVAARETAQPTAVLPRDEQTRQQPTVPSVPAQQQPERIFVPPAPVAPKRKGNRGIGSLIAVVSVVIFGILYALVAAVIVAVAAPGQNLLTTLTRFFTDPVFYVPGILFVVGFVLVVLLVNRAAWWAFVLGSLIVGAIVYFGTIGVQLLTENAFAMTPSEATAAFAAYAVNPFVIAAALVARETSMWIGAAISSRGRRMKARNLTAREEFDKATAAHRAEYDRSYAA